MKAYQDLYTELIAYYCNERKTGSTHDEAKRATRFQAKRKRFYENPAGQRWQLEASMDRADRIDFSS